MLGCRVVKHSFIHCYTSRGALAGARNRSMGPPWRIDPTTNRITSGHSTTANVTATMITTVAMETIMATIMTTTSIMTLSMTHQAMWPWHTQKTHQRLQTAVPNASYPPPPPPPPPRGHNRANCRTAGADPLCPDCVCMQGKHCAAHVDTRSRSKRFWI